MKLNNKILLSALAATMLSLSGCSDSDSDTTTAETETPTETTTLDSTSPNYTGDGADDAQERHLANDATFTLPTTHRAASVSFDQTAVATLAATKTLDTTTLVGEITVDTTLTSGNKYKVDGLVTVKGDVTLTIEPGTIIFGDSTGDDYIVITKGSKIEAAGTEANPIFFTSEAALTDATTADVGQWGGLTILGDAPTNDTSTPSYEVDETNPDFVYGGTNSADNSGTLTHVYILNSGVTMSTDQEVNGLSLCGVGSATTVENIHVENSSDDGIEIWGGTVNITNATLVNCLDDSFDLDSGYVGTATNITVEQVDAAHAGFEISSGGTSPMTSPTIVNFTINKVDGSDEGGIYIKDDSTAPTFVNGFVTTRGTDAGIYAKKVMPADQKAELSFKDVILNIQ